MTPWILFFISTVWAILATINSYKLHHQCLEEARRAEQDPQP